MKSLFNEYFRPDENSLKFLWENCLFAFDASVLLNVYGYSKESAEDLLSWLERIKERVRLPHQFGLEYSRNRPRVILKQVRNYNDAENLCSQLEALFAVKREHPFLTPTALRAFRRIVKELQMGRKSMDALIKVDPYAERILSVFASRVGPAMVDSEFQKICAEAKVRFEKQIPPGYADKGEKNEPECFSDYIGWHQLLEISKKECNPIIFVCDDMKEDWWQHEGKAKREIGPRPELICEFSQSCKQPFFMYQSDSFVIAANAFLSAKISDRTITEIKERLASQRQNADDSRFAKPGYIHLNLSSINQSTQDPPKITNSDAKAKIVDKIVEAGGADEQKQNF